MEAEKTLTNEEIIRELLDLLKKNTMKEQANDVFEICTYVDGLEKKIVSMTEELTSMQDQIKKMQEDTLINNAKKALTEAQERLNARCEQIKSQVSEIKVQVKSTAKNIVDETKAKGRAALYRVTEFVGIKKRLLNVRTAVKDMIVSTDRDIARTALLAKGLREAGQIVNNAFHTFADKPEVDYSQKEQKHPFTKAVLAPMKAVKKLLVSMELHLDASIDKLDNLAMNVQFDKEKRMEQTKDKEQKAPDTEREIIYSPMVAEPQEYKYNADAFAARKTSEAKQETAGKELIPEGYELRNIADALEEKGLIDRSRFEDELEKGKFDYDFINEISRKKNRLEGYLFPATYEIEPGTGEHEIIDMMLKKFNDTVVPLYKQSGSTYSLDEIVTMASLVEREAANDSERGKVASVFYNRLEKGMTLSSCATVQYILKERKTILSTSDTKIKSDYNTYINKGLPVGPIASPGEKSVRAALYPEKTDYLYFAAKADGSANVFSKTGEEHMETVKRLQGK